jgi:hypothetical protein
MAAEAVQQERDTIRALKRLSMGGGGSLALDPELSFGIEHELENMQTESINGNAGPGLAGSSKGDRSVPSIHRRKSSSVSSLSSETSFLDDDDDEEDLTLVDQTKNEEEESGNDGLKVDAEKLLWVPANSHPSIAPDRFKRHVQNALDDMNQKITGSSKRSNSLPSLKELTDELDKLTEMAGLEANDAITLARSLSSASSYSHRLLSKENSLLNRDSGVNRRQSENSINQSETESDIDEDAPIFASSNSLKRNKWNTYSRQRRGTNRDKPAQQSSPLSGGKQFDDAPGPISKNVIQPASHTQVEATESKQQQQQQRKPSLQEQMLNHQQRQRAHRRPSLPQHPEPRLNSSNRGQQLNRSHSDITSEYSYASQDPHKASARTNHSRNRHAGSIINLESDSDNSLKAQVPSDASHSPNPYHKKNPVPTHQPTSQQMSSHQSDWRPAPQPISKDAPASEGTQRNVSNGDGIVIPGPEPKALSAAPITPIFSIGSKKESKSKEFLNLFKMKRSISPKVKDKKTQQELINDENSPFIESSENSDTVTPLDSNNSKQSQFQDFQVEFNQQQQGHRSSPKVSVQKVKSEPLKDKSPQRPTLKNGSSFKFSKQKKILQDSVKMLPSKNMGKTTQKNQIVTSEVYPNATKYRTSPTSPTFERQRGTTEAQPHQQESSAIPPSDQQSQGQQPPLIPHRQKEELQKKLSLESLNAAASSSSQRPNAPQKFTDSPFGFPLPPLSQSTIIMLDYRFPIHVERAIYRLSHLKLGNTKRPLRQQVLLSNFMYAYLNLVNHTLYLQQLEEGTQSEEEQEQEQEVE